MNLEQMRTIRMRRLPFLGWGLERLALNHVECLAENDHE